MTKYFKQKVIIKLLQAVGNTETPGTTEVTVLTKDSAGNVTEAKGTTVPAGEAGYALECEFVDTDKSSGTHKLYRNVGTTSSATWDLTGEIDADEVALADGTVIIGNSAGAGAAKTLSGDLTMTREGVTTVKAGIKTDIVSVGLMGTVAAFGFPFNVVVDTEQAAAFAVIDDGGVQALFNVSAGEGGYASNYQVWPDTELENDAFYMGAADPFGVLTIDISTAATYGADSVEWEYWNGSAWTSLTIIYDETDTNNQSGTRPFMQDGQIIFSAPTAWASTTVNGQAGFWVRARIKSGFNVTQIPIFNSVEHKIVTSPTASEVPAAGTIGRARLSFLTVSGANNDTKIILCNLTKGTASVIKTLTQALIVNEVADFAVLCDAGDQIVIYVTQEDGTTEFANGSMEFVVVKT